MQLKVFDFLDGSGNYWTQHGFKLVKNLKDADILCLNGGADIGTEIYNEVPVDSFIPRLMSRRDSAEIEKYKAAKELGLFIFGICRGAQLITCLEGGSLWQHVDKHYGDHPITDNYTGKTYRTTSIHHQMMRPPKGVPHQIIASCNLSTYKVCQSKEWEHKYAQGDPDPEVIWYPDARALCVQGHPEYAAKSAFADYCTTLITNLWDNPVWPPEEASSRVAV